MKEEKMTMMTENTGRKEEKLRLPERWEGYLGYDIKGAEVYAYMLEDDFYRIAGEEDFDFLKKGDMTAIYDTFEEAVDACYEAVKGAESGYVILQFDNDSGELIAAKCNFDYTDFDWWRQHYNELYEAALQNGDYNAQYDIEKITGMKAYFTESDPDMPREQMEEEDFDFLGLYRDAQDAIDAAGGREGINRHGLYTNDEEILL